MVERAVDIPEFIRLQALKVNDQRLHHPVGIVLKKIREEVESIIGRNGYSVALTDRECVHDDLVGEMMDLIFNRAFEVFEIM